MNGGLSTLGLVEASTTHPERHFLDLVIDGRPLRESVPEADDLVTGLCKQWVPAEVDRAVEELLGRSQAPCGVLLLICAECGDVDCGALGVDIAVARETVTWSNLRWGLASGEDPVPGTSGPWVFERKAYEETLAAAAAWVAALPGQSPGEPRAEPRRRLLPWRRRP